MTNPTRSCIHVLKEAKVLVSSYLVSVGHTSYGGDRRRISARQRGSLSVVALQTGPQKPSPSAAAAAADESDALQKLLKREYKYGFVSDFESFSIPKGLSWRRSRESRPDWLRNAAGLVDANYWRGTLRPRPVLDWYLKRVEEAVAEARQLRAPDGKISLIGHSAGGWLARVYMEEFGASDISLLLTLGTPHLYGFS